MMPKKKPLLPKRDSVSPVAVYDASMGSSISYLASLKRLRNTFWSWRSLAWELFKRDFLASYKRSFLGYLWIFITPLFGILSWLLFQSIGILKPGATGVPYPIYILVGTTIWGLFMGSVGAASSVLTSSAGLMTQVKYPHEIMVWKSLAQVCAQFLISATFIFAIMIGFRVGFSGMALLAPFAFIPVIVMGISIGLIQSCLQVVAPDIHSLTNMVLGFMLFLSPIVYSAESVAGGFIGRLMNWNPLTHLICVPRDLILYGRITEPAGYSWSVAFALIAFFVVWRAFLIVEPRLVERLQ